MRQPASTSRPASVGEIPAMPTSVPIEQRIAVVIGSTRPTRICADIAAWTREAIQDGSELAYELMTKTSTATGSSRTSRPRCSLSWRGSPPSISR